MKFAIAKEHRDFFQKQGWIEFEDLISKDQLHSINQAIDQVLAERLLVLPERLRTISSEKIYLQGHDLWRSHEVLKKIVTQIRLTETASELIEKKPLRLGCDQLFPARQQTPFSPSTSQIYTQFLQQTQALESVSCIQGLACGLMIALAEDQKNSIEESPTGGIDIFPRQLGHVIFFQPQSLINWESLYLHKEQRFYLIVYAHASACYQLQSKDPHTHALKHLGYIFNDKLNDRLNPIVYR